MDPAVVAALMAVVGGTTGTAIVSGWFSSRQAKIAAQTTNEGKLWERIADLEKRLWDQAQAHRVELDTVHRQYRTELDQLERNMLKLQAENLELAGKLQTSMIEVQGLRARVVHGAGVSIPPSSLPEPGTDPSSITSSWKTSDVIDAIDNHNSRSAPSSIESGSPPNSGVKGE